MKWRVHLAFLVGMLLLSPVTASAEAGVQLSETSGGFRAKRATGTTRTLDSVRWYSYQCTYWAEGPENIPFAQVVLTINGFVAGIAYGGGAGYVEVSTYAEVQSTPYDQEVVCEGFSVAGSASARDLAPGLPDSESTELHGWDGSFAEFIGQLSPSNGPYSTRWVFERSVLSFTLFR